MSKHYGRKIKQTRLIRISTNSDVWGHFYGILTTLGLVITVIYSILTFKEGIKEEATGKVILLLSTSIIVLIIVFFFNSRYFNRKIQELSDIPKDYYFLKKEKDRFDIVLNQLSECSHIITHYYRNINVGYSHFINNQDEYKDKDIIDLVDRFNDFMINVTTNLQQYFTLITEDNCSITIKLLNNQTGNVKTYFRDPVNFKKRRDAGNGICHYSDNTAFEIIISPNYSNTYFSEDDLVDLHGIFQYKNPNHEWFKYYNSTLVVPISLLIEKDKRNIIGFLSVDNYKGNLAFNSNKEYLFFVSDLLYCAIDKFSTIVEIANEKGLEDEKISRFKDWS